ncbi:hypothetical protein [Haloarcula brevis]|uniref:hypothetical protein n=1 Tax=Haloarcula brevis TaxID=3111453 RepID=UPI00300E7B6F
MSSSTFRERIRPKALLVMLAIVAIATYLEFVYLGQPNIFSVLIWIIVVPLVLSATVEGVRDHPLYQPIFYGALIAIGVLQYLDGEWTLLAGVFVLGGVIGLLSQVHNRRNTSLA